MTTPTTSRGLLLPCPKCGEAQASLTLCLADMDALHCQDCEEDYTLDDVRQLIAQWQPVLAWIDAAPQQAE